ncbi:MAG: arginyltransferase [Desulfobulbus sp.]|jgi:arginyl-tRNA--protein-N-Asp/Glu arginylyltransferase
MFADNRWEPAPAEDEELERAFVDAVAECPYGKATPAVYHQACLGRIDDRIMAHLLARGYRRNGNTMYAMRCPLCRLCVPIRLRTDRFRANRNQRRVWKKNQDVTVDVAPLTVSREKLDLLQRFLTTRFPGGDSDAESYYASFFITAITQCLEIRYRVDGQLFAVSIIDVAPSWLNAVYFFFDPLFSRRSPGTLNILTLHRLCVAHDVPLLYLGYWIPGHRGMDYKQVFRPHEVLVDGIWQERGG